MPFAINVVRYFVMAKLTDLMDNRKAKARILF